MMIHLTLHCDICLRARTEPSGWWAVVEVPEVDFTERRVKRVCVIREIDEKESPGGETVKACCGVECLTKAMHGYVTTVLGERAGQPGGRGR